MDVVHTIAVADDQPAPLTPEKKLAARERASVGILILILLVGFLAFCVVLLAVSRARRNARLRAMKVDTHRRRQAISDAWIESGKRVEVPEPEELERDRLNLDDTDMNGSPPPEDPPQRP